MNQSQNACRNRPDRKTIDRLGENPTRQDERDYLVSVYNVPAGAYMHSLFSQELLTWALAQMDMDVSPDVMAAWRCSEMQSEAQIRALSERVTLLERKLRQAEEKNDQLGVAKAEAERRAWELDQGNRDLRVLLQAEADKRAQARRAAAAEVAALQALVAELEQELVETKAGAFDRLLAALAS